MYQDKTFACIIPARGGSKGVPRKNVRLLLEKPMIAHVIDSAKEAGIFDTIVVTTDDTEIAAAANMYGARVVMRPPELAEDDSLVEDAIEHAMGLIDEHDYILLLEPTSPMLSAADILRAAKRLVNKKADMIISVARASPDMATVGRLGPDGSLKDFLPKDVRKAPRQKRPQYYYLNSAIYMGKWRIFREKLDYYEQNTIAYIMHPDDCIHVDTEEDFIKVSRMLSKRRQYQAFLNG